MKRLYLVLILIVFSLWCIPVNAMMLISGRPPAGGCSETLLMTLDAAGANGAVFGKDDTADITHLAGSFTADNNYTVTKVTIYMEEAGTASGNLYAYLYSNTGSDPDTVISNGTSDAVDGSTIGTPASDIDFPFSGTYPTISNSTVYHVVVAAPGISATYWWKAYYNNTGSNEINKSTDGSSWANHDTSAELRAAIYGCVTP